MHCSTCACTRIVRMRTIIHASQSASESLLKSDVIFSQHHPKWLLWISLQTLFPLKKHFPRHPSICGTMHHECTGHASHMYIMLVQSFSLKSVCVNLPCAVTFTFSRRRLYLLTHSNYNASLPQPLPAIITLTRNQILWCYWLLYTPRRSCVDIW